MRNHTIAQSAVLYAWLGMLLSGLTGCQSPAPTGTLSAEGGVLMTQPRLSFDGNVGGMQYEPFELGPITHRIGGNAILSSASMNGERVSVVAPKTENIVNGMTLVHEALRDNDVATADGQAAFRKQLKKLFALHKKHVRDTVVILNDVVIAL